jgi:hypothetical protein
MRAIHVACLPASAKFSTSAEIRNLERMLARTGSLTEICSA